MSQLELGLMAGIRLLKVMSGLDLGKRIERVRINNAVQSLREIFFFPSELLSALEALADGKEIEAEFAEFLAEEYDGISPRIQQAFDFIDVERFGDNRSILLDDLEMMVRIQYGKVDLRRDIHRLFRAYQDDRGRNPGGFAEQAARLLGQVERLNSAIKVLEAKLLRAREGAPGTRSAEQGKKTPKLPARRPTKVMSATNRRSEKSAV